MNNNLFDKEYTEEARTSTKKFLKKLESEMAFASTYNGDLLSFDWLDEIEEACPRIDKIVRVVIPKEIRKQLKIENDVDSFEVYLDGDTVLLKKYQPCCIFCNNADDIVYYKGKRICADCLKTIKENL